VIKLIFGLRLPVGDQIDLQIALVDGDQIDLQIALAGGIFVILYDTRSRQQHVLPGHRHAVNCLAKNNSGTLLGKAQGITKFNYSDFYI
jgi:hypothetical protein